MSLIHPVLPDGSTMMIADTEEGWADFREEYNRMKRKANQQDIIEDKLDKIIEILRYISRKVR